MLTMLPAEAHEGLLPRNREEQQNRNKNLEARDI
jgi:hypothetical protein